MTENEEIKKVINGLNFLKEKLYNGIYADRLDCIDSAKGYANGVGFSIAVVERGGLN